MAYLAKDRVDVYNITKQDLMESEGLASNSILVSGYGVAPTTPYHSGLAINTQTSIGQSIGHSRRSSDVTEYKYYFKYKIGMTNEAEIDYMVSLGKLSLDRVADNRELIYLIQKNNEHNGLLEFILTFSEFKDELKIMIV